MLDKTNMLSPNPKVDFYFANTRKWREETDKLRSIALGSGLAEELKWGCPCYILGKSNVVLIHTFKEYCAVLFFKGALLKNEDGFLIQQSENVQSARQMRFTSIGQVLEREQVLKACIQEAIELEKAGRKVELKKPSAFKMAVEFETKLSYFPDLKKAFEALTPGRQRAYLLHFSQPKLPKTREDRVEKAIPRILEGKGLND